MNNLVRTKKQAVIAAIALIIIIVLGTAGVVFALTSSAPKAADPVPEQSQQMDPEEQAEPREPADATEAAERSPAGNFITLDEAKQIALSDAGLTESQVTFYNVKLTQDDGIQIYEVEFYSKNKEYEYEINASSGRILDSDIDYDDDYDEEDDDD